ncbi:MAG TPA: hypothetical protein VJT71_19695 [Pyrinomonadaceae bacterium]|nr:hypothetical protein [Pyrinomonadaceae bacterium]
MNISLRSGLRTRRAGIESNSIWTHVAGLAFCFLMVLATTAITFSQTRTYPKEIRGYKVERAAVELKRADKAAPIPTDQKGQETSSSGGGAGNTNQTQTDTSSDADVDQLITFGPPELARVTPLGITFEVPIVVAPIKQSGHVEFLLFEDMTVNDHSVEIDEYHRAFDLPTKRALKLREPLRFFISTPTVALAAVDEWSNSKETWPVIGRVYVCGKFKRFLIKSKRCVPVELDLAMRNPLRKQ